MSKLQYLSPTSLSLFLQDKDEFYRQYLSKNRKKRDPQNQAMSIGSAFDSYVKSYLYEKLFGKGSGINGAKYDLRELFEAQVEEQNRDWAWEHGRYVFEQYKSSGALADIMLELSKATGEPRFEFSIMGVVNGRREGVSKEISDKIYDVTFLGKPDASFVTSEGVHVILDWKVNGYCSNRAISPAQGYVRLRKAGKTDFGSHKKAIIHNENGIMINIMHNLEDVKEDWARQLAIYGWILGEPVGSSFIVAIDQVCCDNSNFLSKRCLPEIKIAEHRVRIGERYQKKLFDISCEAWEVINSDHFFRDLSKEDSKSREQMLDGNVDESGDEWLKDLFE